MVRNFENKKKALSGHREYVQEDNICKYEPIQKKKKKVNSEPCEKSKSRLHP